MDIFLIVTVIAVITIALAVADTNAANEQEKQITTLCTSKIDLETESGSRVMTHRLLDTNQIILMDIILFPTDEEAKLVLDKMATLHKPLEAVSQLIETKGLVEDMTVGEFRVVYASYNVDAVQLTLEKENMS